MSNRMPHAKGVGDYVELGIAPSPDVRGPLLIAIVLLGFMVVAVGAVLWTLRLFGGGPGIVVPAILVGFVVALPDFRRAFLAHRDPGPPRLRVGSEGFQVGKGEPIGWGRVRRLATVGAARGESAESGVRLLLGPADEGTAEETLRLYAEDYGIPPDELASLLRTRLESHARAHGARVRSVSPDPTAPDQEYVLEPAEAARG